MLRMTAEAGLLDRANQVKFLKGSADTLPSPSLVQPLCPPHLGPQHLFSLPGPSIRILVPVSSFRPTWDILQGKPDSSSAVGTLLPSGNTLAVPRVPKDKVPSRGPFWLPRVMISQDDMQGPVMWPVVTLPASFILIHSITEWAFSACQAPCNALRLHCPMQSSQGPCAKGTITAWEDSMAPYPQTETVLSCHAVSLSGTLFPPHLQLLKHCMTFRARLQCAPL